MPIIKPSELCTAKEQALKNFKKQFATLWNDKGEKLISDTVNYAIQTSHAKGGMPEDLEFAIIFYMDRKNTDWYDDLFRKYVEDTYIVPEFEGWKISIMYSYSNRDDNTLITVREKSSSPYAFMFNVTISGPEVNGPTPQ